MSFRLAIAGSRKLDSRLVEGLLIELVPRVVGHRRSLTALGTGDAPGADEGARLYMARYLAWHDPDLPCRVYSARGPRRPPSMPRQAELVVCSDWNGTEGRGAGMVRNGRLIADHDALLLIWTGSSPGSTDVLARAKRRKLPVWEVTLKRHLSPVTASEPAGKG